MSSICLGYFIASWMPPLSPSVNKHTAYFLKHSRISSSKCVYGVLLKGVHYQTQS